MFLQKVYRKWKALFWVILVFMIFQFFFMYKGIQNIPFFLYHMYAMPHMRQDSIPVLLIKTNKGYFSPFSLSNREAEMLTNNIPYYDLLKKNHYKDPLINTVDRRLSPYCSKSRYHYLEQSLINDSITISGFPQWWKGYFQFVSNKHFDSISVVISHVWFKPTFSKSRFDSTIFSVHITR